MYTTTAIYHVTWQAFLEIRHYQELQDNVIANGLGHIYQKLYMKKDEKEILEFPETNN